MITHSLPPSMAMLTLLQQDAIRVLQLGYAYLYRHPVHWNLKQSKIELNVKSKIRPVAFKFMLILIAMLTFAYFYVPFTYLLGCKRQGFNIYYIALYLSAGTVSAGILYLIWVVVNHTSVLESINKFLDLKQQLSSEFQNVEDTIRWDYGLIPGAIFICMAPVFLILLLQILEFDAFYFLFEGVLPSALYRSIKTICASFAARVVLMTGLLELGRTTGIAGISAYVYANAVLVCMKELSRNRFCFKNKLKYYRQSLLIWALGRDAVSYIMGVAIPAVFYGTVFVWWLVIKGYQNLPLFMYIFVILSAVIFVLGYISAMDIFVKIANYSIAAKRKCCLNVLMFYVLSTTISRRKLRIVTLQCAKAIRPIKVPYGGFLEIDKEFACEMAYSMLVWVLNSVLLI
ncbi:unnamed protein product [Orchesella dallaii]|uniref:Gustatory receptor n=1 Tax=Orchesella dallaii TaxID=48710 RepID=A0ABP1RAN9_9HEXA